MQKQLVGLLFIAWAWGLFPGAAPTAQAGLFQMFFGQGQAEDVGQGTHSGAEVSAMYVDDGTDMEDLREMAIQEIHKFREQQPHETIEISIMLNTPGGPPGSDGEQPAVELGRAIQKADHNSRSFQIAPTEHLSHHIRNVPDHQNPLFSSQANQRLRLFKTTIVAVRTVNAGVVVGLMLFIANELPWQAALAGGIGAAAMSGELMRIDDQVNEKLGARPFWDRSGRLTGPRGQKIYKILNFPTPYLRHGGLIAGYLVVVHWLTVAAGAPAEHLHSPSAWMFHKTFLAGLSALTVGQWRQVQKTLFNRAMTRNSIRNYGDFDAGVNGATAIKVKSWTAAVAISLVAITIDALSLGEYTEHVAPYVMAGVGITGGLTLAWICTDFPAFMKRNLAKFKQAASKVWAATDTSQPGVFGAAASRCALAFRRRQD